VKLVCSIFVISLRKKDFFLLDDLLDENSYSMFQGFLRTPISQHIGNDPSNFLVISESNNFRSLLVKLGYAHFQE